MPSEAPPFVFVRQPCPACGAVTKAEAEQRCKPIVSCLATGETDAEGFLVVITPESVAAYAAWEAEQQ